MGKPMRGCSAFGANIALIQKPIGVTLNFHYSIVFYAHQKGAAAVIHSGTVGFSPTNLFRHNFILSMLASSIWDKQRKFQAPSSKAPNSNTQIQMVRQAHHPEPSRRVNSKFQYSMSKTFEILNLGHCNLFDIWDLLFGILNKPVFHYLGDTVGGKINFQSTICDLFILLIQFGSNRAADYFHQVRLLHIGAGT
jgi:hypothetical protein